ncbi:MAG: molecular chaperone DnaJ [Ruminococcus sp.]|nr:molecular chaperone DnaJ [Ruminococcus sp.]
MLKWFKDCANIEEAKERYKRLCREYHPDLNTDDTTDIMQEINTEFEQVFKTLKNTHKANTESTNENAADTETPAEFMEIINRLVNCEGLEINVCGRWLWLVGNTYPYKDIIKSLNFKWASKKKAWYWHTAEDNSRNRKQMTLDEIKALHGCKTFATASMPKLAAI